MIAKYSFCLLMALCLGQVQLMAQKLVVLDATLKQRLPDWLLLDEGEGKAYQVIDSIEPAICKADFNGDGQEDVAFRVKEEGGPKVGVAIVFRGSPQVVSIVGAGMFFGNGGDDFSWMDTFGVYRKPTATHNRYDPDTQSLIPEPKELAHPAILVGKEEVGNHLVYWNGQKFIWIHQGC